MLIDWNSVIGRKRNVTNTFMPFQTRQSGRDPGKDGKTTTKLVTHPQMLSRAVSEGLLCVSVANSVNEISTGNM